MKKTTFVPNNLGPDYSLAYASQGREHIAIGSSHPAYNSNPPTSGWHYAEEAKLGIYDKELPNEQLVHNLEHGNIWFIYHPLISPEVLAELK